MARRYRRTTVETMQRLDVPLREFPSGEGPPLMVRRGPGEWTRLGLNRRAEVEFAPGGGGAFAFGLARSRAVVWVRFLPGGAGSAFCYHAPPGPFDTRVHDEACLRVGWAPTDASSLWVVLAARGEVEPWLEGVFEARGVAPDRILTYSGCWVPQFGVSATGCVGEVP